MTDMFPLLHDPHNGRLRLKLPVGRDTDMRFFVLLLCLFELDRVDLDTIFGVSEGCIEGEGICRANVTTLGVFGERSKFGAGKRLERSLDFGIGWKEMS